MHLPVFVISLIVLGASLVLWHRARVARGADPLGPVPQGELPDTGVALVLGVLLWLLVPWLLVATLSGTELRRSVGRVADVVAGAAIVSLVAGVLVRATVSRTRRPVLPARRLVGAGVLGGVVVFAAAGGLAFLIERVHAAIGRAVPQQELVQLAQDAAGLERAALAVAAVVLAPFAEEVFFRGILLPVTVRLAGVRPGLVLQALCFGAIHLVNDASIWPLVIPLAAVGWIVGWLYLRTASLVVPVLAHATFNAINFALLLSMGQR